MNYQTWGTRELIAELERRDRAMQEARKAFNTITRACNHKDCHGDICNDDIPF